MPACKVCRQPFERMRPMQAVCCGDCALALVRRKREVERATVAKVDRKLTRSKLEAMKRRRDWLAEAQAAFNRYVRLRDVRAGYGCISCAKRHGGATKIGGAFDCGHYRSRGSAPHLRFHLHNVALQCKRCNDARKGAGMPIEFERGLRARLGDARVDELKADQALRKFPVDYLRRLKAIFAKKARREERRGAA